MLAAADLGDPGPPAPPADLARVLPLPGVSEAVSFGHGGFRQVDVRALHRAALQDVARRVGDEIRRAIFLWQHADALIEVFLRASLRFR